MKNAIFIANSIWTSLTNKLFYPAIKALLLDRTHVDPESFIQLFEAAGDMFQSGQAQAAIDFNIREEDLIPSLAYELV